MFFEISLANYNRNNGNIKTFLSGMADTGIYLPSFKLWASPVAQTVKHLPAMQETRVQSLGQKDPLEKRMATPFQYSCLKNLMDRGAWWATVHGVAKSWT